MEGINIMMSTLLPVIGAFFLPVSMERNDRMGAVSSPTNVTNHQGLVVMSMEEPIFLWSIIHCTRFKHVCHQTKTKPSLLLWRDYKMSPQPPLTKSRLANVSL